MSNSIALPASLQPPSPPPNVMDTTPGANPTEPVAYYQLSSGHVASLPQSSVPALMKQDSGAKQIPSPANGEVLVQLSSGHTATLPVTSLPALKQQDPGYKYIAGDTTAPKQFTPGFDALSAVTGPGTALGTPAPPLLASPHVVSGSWLEKAIQHVDPSFKGGATDEQVKEYQDKYDALGHPLVDIASTIDKQKQPIARALAETGQSLLTPSTIATMYATGGLGLVESPAALGMANKLISSGFSAAAIADAYKNLKGFKQAYDSGDSNEAAYRLTHAITSGALGLLAARDAAPAMSSAVRDIMNPFTKGAAAANRVAGANPIDTAVTDSVAKAKGIPVGSPANVTPPTGETIQPTLQQGLRNAVNQTAAANGFEDIPTTTPIRNVPKALGDQAYARSQSTFDAAEKATGINFTALKQNIFKIDDQISDLAITDPEKAGQLAQQKLAYEQQVTDGLKQAEEKGVDVAQARSDWNLQLRANELSTHVRNSAEGTLHDSTLNPTKLTPRLQKMNEAEVGQQTAPLTQLLGEDAASRLVSHAENARAAATEIKNFEPSGPTGQQALRDIIRPNTGASTLQSMKQALGIKPTTNWVGAFRDFNKLSTAEQTARFGADAPQAYSFLKGQARAQVIKGVAKGITLAAVAHATGVDRDILGLILGE